MKKEAKKTTEKYVTDKTFQKAMADHAEIMTVLLKEIRTIHEDNKYFRQSISNLNIDNLSYDRKIKNLDARVEKLELKIK